MRSFQIDSTLTNGKTTEFYHCRRYLIVALSIYFPIANILHPTH